MAVCSLLHFLADHSGWVLPTALLCGARTFLGAHLAARDATVWPARSVTQRTVNPMDEGLSIGIALMDASLGPDNAVRRRLLARVDDTGLQHVAFCDHVAFQPAVTC